MKTAIEDIARRVLLIDTLETRNSDGLDFHERAVWLIRDALEAAYKAGEAASAMPATTTTHQGIVPDLADQLKVFDTRFLLALHHGDADAVGLARRELAERGIDGAGRWVGFAKAAEALGL